MCKNYLIIRSQKLDITKKFVVSCLDRDELKVGACWATVKVHNDNSMIMNLKPIGTIGTLDFNEQCRIYGHWIDGNFEVNNTSENLDIDYTQELTKSGNLSKSRTLSKVREAYLLEIDSIIDKLKGTINDLTNL